MNLFMYQRGMGNYQKISRKITHIQVIYALLERPFTFGELRVKTRIQPNTLHSVLKSFKEKDMVIKHKLFVNKSYFKDKDFRIIKPSLDYYILNLNNIEVQKLIVDPTPYYLECYIKDYDHSGDSELKKYDENLLKKAKSTAEDIIPSDYCSLDLIEKTKKEAEKDFLDNNMKEMSDEERIKRLDRFDREFKKSKGYVEYQNHLKKLKEKVNETKYRFDQMLLILKPKFLEEMEKFIKNGNGSALDFIIIESCEQFNMNSPSLNYYWYRAIWKMFEQYYFNAI